jgi:IS30 family transposase
VIALAHAPRNRQCIAGDPTRLLRRQEHRDRRYIVRLSSPPVCKRTRPVLVLHERKSRVTLAARLAGKTAAETISVMLAIFARIKPALRKSITFDNDTAFAQHGLLQCAIATWFCNAYASWQKGGVENANGRLRRWLPRHIDIDRLSDAEIQDIVITANLTPRKCLGFKTPSRRSSKSLAKTPKSASLEPVALRARIYDRRELATVHSRYVPGSMKSAEPMELMPSLVRSTGAASRLPFSHERA